MIEKKNCASQHDNVGRFVNKEDGRKKRPLLSGCAQEGKRHEDKTQRNKDSLQNRKASRGTRIMQCTSFLRNIYFDNKGYINKIYSNHMYLCMYGWDGCVSHARIITIMIMIERANVGSETDGVFFFYSTTTTTPTTTATPTSATTLLTTKNQKPRNKIKH